MAMNPKRREQVLIHLSGYRGLWQGKDMPYGVTSKGMAVRMGVSRSDMDGVLKRMEDSGLVFHEVKHVRGTRNKARCYMLRPLGWMIANELRSEEVA